MSDFSASSIGTDQRPSSHDHSSANSSSKCDHDHILLTMSSTFPHLTECRYIGIIANNNLPTCQIL